MLSPKSAPLRKIRRVLRWAQERLRIALPYWLAWARRTRGPVRDFMNRKNCRVAPLFWCGLMRDGFPRALRSREGGGGSGFPKLQFLVKHQRNSILQNYLPTGLP